MMVTTNYRLIVITTFSALVCMSSSFVSSSSLLGYTQSKIASSAAGGDLILSALLPMHLSRSDRDFVCDELYPDGTVLVEAVVFALREVHRRKLLPENITMGYEIRDTCGSVLISQRHTLDIVLETMKEKQVREYSNSNNTTPTREQHNGHLIPRKNVIAVLGAGNSELSIAVNRLLSAFDIPQIGFASTSRLLSDKARFPSFFRVVPSDSLQVKALVALFRTFSWNYVGLLVSDGDYGRPLAESFKSMAKVNGVCISFERLIPYSVTQASADAIIREVSSKTELEVIVILVSELDIKTILSAILSVGLSNKTLIASDSWSKSTRNYDPKFATILKGTLGFANHDVHVREFEKYFLSLKPDANAWNPWFNETWEHLFNCKLSKANFEIQVKRNCNLSEEHLSRKQFTGFHRVFDVINAVFVAAHGVRQFCQKLMKNNDSSNGSTTPCLSAINPQELLEQLKGMTFPGYYGEDIAFDNNGDVKGKYDLVNIPSDLVAKDVGVWQEFEKRDILYANVSNIEWNSAQGPQSVCARPCPPGMHRRPAESDPQCCWTCQRCLEGTISNGSGATSCTPCGEHLISNSNRTACVFIPVNYLDWRSSWTVCIVVIALISMLVLIFVAVLFVRYANTPVVKASNRELSFLLCLGLLATFLMPFAFAGKPSATKCIISQTMFCVGTALALSAVLAKTCRIVLVFKTESRNQGRLLLKNKYEIALTLVLTFIELTYCLLWVAINPPGVKTIRVTQTKRYLICEFDRWWYGGSHLLLIILSLACTALAYKGRKLPKNFNEMKYIAMSMFTFNIIWVVFMLAQYGASLEYDAKINCFATITSSMMILLLLFGPKIFMMLFRPQLNRKEEFQEDARRYAFRHSGMLHADLSRSSRSVSAQSLKRGSLSNLHLNSNDRLTRFSVPNDLNVLDRKRKMLHGYSPAVASTNNLFQGSPTIARLPKTPSKGRGVPENVEESNGHATPIAGKIMNHATTGQPHVHIYWPETSYPGEKIVSKDRRAPLCSTYNREAGGLKEIPRRYFCDQCYHQTIKQFSLSLPNITITAAGESSDNGACVTETEPARSPFPVNDNSLKSTSSSSRCGQEVDAMQSTKAAEEPLYKARNRDCKKDFSWDNCDRDVLKAGYESARETNL